MTSKVKYKDNETVMLTMRNGMRVTARYSAQDNNFYWGNMLLTAKDIKDIESKAA